MTQEEYLEELRAQRASAERHLSYFKRGMKVVSRGVDRTSTHVNALKKMIARYDKMLDNA